MPKPSPCLLVSPDFPPPLVGGSFVYIYNLVAHVPEEAEWEILTAPRRPELTEVDVPHRIVRNPNLVTSNDPARFALVRMYAYFVWAALTAWRRRPLVVVNSGLVGNALLILTLRLWRVPVVGVAYAEELTIPLGSRGVKNALKRRLLRLAYPRASGFVVVSEFTGDVLESIGVERERVQFVNVMIAPEKHIELGEPGPARRAADHAGRLVLSSGRLFRRKGYDLLVDAMSDLVPDRPDLHLVVVGDGPERPNLEKHVAELGLGDHVTISGRVSDDALAELYSTCDVFVLANVMLPNGDTEGSPTVAVEAGAWGKPVVIGQAGGTASVVDHGVTGFIVDCADPVQLRDHLARLLDDADLRHRMGTEARRKVARDHDPVRNSRVFHEFVCRHRRPESSRRVGARRR